MYIVTKRAQKEPPENVQLRSGKKLSPTLSFVGEKVGWNPA